MQLVLASNNAKKIAEIRSLLADVQLLSLHDVGFTADIPEPFSTFRENAAHKAETVYRFCNLPTLADDSGLCVDALNGAPGVFSARYSGTPTDDGRNNKKLLDALKNISDRSAAFVCVLALAGLKAEPIFFEGKISGTIGFEETGAHGFGYDPLFIPKGQTASFAALPSAYKAAHSHRSKALEQLKAYLG